MGNINRGLDYILKLAKKYTKIEEAYTVYVHIVYAQTAPFVSKNRQDATCLLPLSVLLLRQVMDRGQLLMNKNDLLTRFLVPGFLIVLTKLKGKL
jgi:hypothetical protein